MVGFKSGLKPTCTARKLKTNDPRIVHKYLKVLRKQLDKDDVLQRALALTQSIHENILTPNQIAEYEALDILRTKAMKTAENQCRKLKMGSIK